MLVLHDTCAILMLLRIAPEMFKNPAYGCMTLIQVKNEYVRNPVFKSKYPWRGDFAHHISITSEYQLRQKGFDKRRKQVSSLCQAVQNPRTGHAYDYDLSAVDKDIAAALVTIDAELCTGDTNLASFVEEQLEIICHSPLAILNRWIDEGLVVWSEAHQAVITEWVSQEKTQPANEINRFEELTAKKYPRFTKAPQSRSKPQK